MKRLLAVCCVLFMSGCAQLKEGVDKSTDALLNPPDQIWEQIKHILAWFGGLLVDFFTNLAGAFGF